MEGRIAFRVETIHSSPLCTISSSCAHATRQASHSQIRTNVGDYIESQRLFFHLSMRMLLTPSVFNAVQAENMEYTPFDYFINGKGLEVYSEHSYDICFVTKVGQYSSTLKNMEPEHISVLKENWHHFDPKQHVEQVHPIRPRGEA